MSEQFIAGRKKFRLREANLLLKGVEKRHSFVFECTLTDGDDTMNGFPEFIQNAYTIMLKSANRQKRIAFDERIENVAIEFWSTFKIRTRVFPVVIGATLAKFNMERVGKTDEADVVLTFTAVFLGRKEIHEWTWDHKKHDFWASFEPQQGSLLDSSAENGEGEDVEDDVDDDESEDDE